MHSRKYSSIFTFFHTIVILYVFKRIKAYRIIFLEFISFAYSFVNIVLIMHSDESTGITGLKMLIKLIYNKDWPE
jgi:hypothetical protein